MMIELEFKFSYHLDLETDISRLFVSVECILGTKLEIFQFLCLNWNF